MRVLKFTMILPFIFIFLGKAQAQGKYGTGQDSIDCIKNLNFYTEDYKRKDYKAAYPAWQEALRLCPKSSQNLYIHGVNILRDRIKNIQDPTQKQAAIDSLINLYDMRISAFPKSNKADLLYRKAAIVEQYKADDHKAIYETYLASINANKTKGEIAAAAKAMIEAQKMYEKQQITAEVFTNTYTDLTDIVDERIRAINRNENIDTVALKDAMACKSAIESSFMSTDAANCENLIALFTPRFESNKTDISTVGMIVNILSLRECTQNDLFYQAAEAYQKLDPSPKSAYTLALMFHSKGEMPKAIEYYKQAIDGQTDPTDKSNYQVALAQILLQQGQTGQAMNYANQALKSNPRNGKAYMILANVYAGIKGCGSDKVSQRSVFWVAVDMLQKAKQVDTDPKFVDAVNSQINVFRQHFPSYDDCFDLDIFDGESYTVNCGGINQRTIVRTRK